MFGPNDLWEILQKLERTGRPVRLLNNYKGIPIAYEATIVQETPDGFIAQVNKYQNVCMEIEKVTFIQSDQLPAVIRARILSVDIVQAIALLGEFSIAPDNIGGREAVRVQPKDPIQVVLSNPKRKLTGNLVDISVSGVGITIVTSFLYNPDLIKKASVTLELKLPVEQGNLRVPGLLASVLSRRSGNYRLGVVLNLDNPTRQIIARFVAMRQAEILREMRSYYDLLYKIQVDQNNELRQSPPSPPGSTR